MPHTFVLFLTLGTLVLSACRKDEGPASLSGSVYPYNGAISFSLHDPNTGVQVQTTEPNGNGEYSFTNIAAGTYIIRVKTTPLFDVPEGVKVSVSAYRHTDVPVIQLVFNDAKQEGSIAFSMDGSPQYIGPQSLFLTHFFTQFMLQGTFYAGPTKHMLFLNLSGVSDTGTFSMGGIAHHISVAEFASNGNFVKSWSTTLDDSTSVASITEYNPQARTASGTFSATLMPNDSMGPARKVSGAFSKVLY